MKNIAVAFIGLLLLSCTGQFDGKIVTPHIEKERGLNLDSLLMNQDELNFMKDGTLMLCNRQIYEQLTKLILFDQMNKTKETRIFEGVKKDILIYSFDQSKVKIVPNGKEKDLACGVIHDMILLDLEKHENTITREKFLSSMFKPSDLFEKIERMIVSLDEMGEAEAIVTFEHGNIQSFKYLSAYSWISCE